MSSTARGFRPSDTLTGAVHVLLVEDDEGDAFLVQEQLIDAGSTAVIHRANTLAEATVQLPGDIDCVLLDLGLPDAGGMEALRVLLEVSPGIAVIVLTGLTDEHRGTEAVAAGAQDYLVKGTIDGQLLTRAIRYAIERKRADESVRRLYESEARAAENARLERGLLPQPLVRNQAVAVVTRYRPGGQRSLLGGDFYDVIECPDGTIFALIGDVAGHGPDEAALGVCLRIAWRTLVLSGIEPDEILRAMDAVLVSERGSAEVFATVSMVRLEPTRAVMTCWLAGHPLPAVIQNDRLRSIPAEAAGLALGVVDHGRWHGVELPLPPGSSLLLFTDGLIEGLDGQGGRHRLGESGLHVIADALLARDDLDGSGFADALLAEVRERNGGDLTDDVAVMLLSLADSA